MTVQRGDIVLVPFPFVPGTTPKVRPALVVQSDHNNSRLTNTVIVQITGNVSRAGHEPTQVLVDVATPEGKQSGLRSTSAITCENVMTIDQRDIHKTIGRLSASLMARVDQALKTSLALP